MNAPFLDDISASLPLIERFRAVRMQTMALCTPLETEDYVVSSMVEVSPTKWHLAHTTWFFETFIVKPYLHSYQSLDSRYAFLFNSYYEQVGARHCRSLRGLATRPTVAEVFSYRMYVDEAVEILCEMIGDDLQHPAWRRLEMGLHHEQQHQELLLTDIKHVLWTNPLRPAYRNDTVSSREPPFQRQRWEHIDEGLYTIGGAEEEFTFDNERPAHKTYLQAAKLAQSLVTNAEYEAFIADGGYRISGLWLSDGWRMVQSQQWQAPLYWEQQEGQWREFTLRGEMPVVPSMPVCHISYYEADAFARWAGYRLPTEAEWEVLAARHDAQHHAIQHINFHPSAAWRNTDTQQLFGHVWQWTRSPYIAYPGFYPSCDVLGEYNGKFMCDQWVLRGSSCLTPPNHTRTTYRNFFPSDARWQFTGLRLAADG
ncbi:MAG: ergothioneine biosynthesis protein EgtB [Nitrosomonas sp.]|nr:ergothioneine biosynthesis protein EgtB [Nitrosomonas sp.]